MRLKLSGPDYKGQEPRAALADFKRRVEIYERNYVPLGEFEEKHHMQYVQVLLPSPLLPPLSFFLSLTAEPNPARLTTSRGRS